MRLTHITTTAIVLALAIATAPAAAAGNQPAAPAVLPNPDQQQLTQPNPARAAATPAVQPNPDQPPAAGSAPAVIVRTSVPNNAFDWGDAAIGAAAALGLAAIGLAGALTITHRRTRRSARAAG